MSKSNGILHVTLPAQWLGTKQAYNEFSLFIHYYFYYSLIDYSKYLLSTDYVSGTVLYHTMSTV